MIVMKFDGSSLADAASLRHAGTLIRECEAAPCVVLCAIGDSTDRLLRIVSLAADGDIDAAAKQVEALVADTSRIQQELLQSPCSSQTSLTRLRGDIDALVRGAARHPDRARITDAIVAHGARIATLLLTAHLTELGANAIQIDARDVVRTNATFGKARPQTGAIRQLAHQNIGPHLARGVTVLTQGDVGGTADRSTTTLGQGGRDWSAALLGAALGADELQIWTDVEGPLTADPSIVPTAQPIIAMSPEEAAERAAFGARGLHPSTIQPVVDKGIAVTVRQTMRPRGSHTGKRCERSGG